MRKASHHGESLLEKLSDEFMDGTPLNSVPQNQRLRRSIVDYLQRLLNTRKGTLPHLPEYGVPDVAQIYRSLPRSLEELKSHLTRLIQEYEPRLRNVTVLPLPFKPSEARIAFEISAVLFKGGEIQMRTVFSATGKASIQSRIKYEGL